MVSEAFTSSPSCELLAEPGHHRLPRRRPWEAPPSLPGAAPHPSRRPLLLPSPQLPAEPFPEADRAR
jgi:hypothetical protein